MTMKNRLTSKKVCSLKINADKHMTNNCIFLCIVADPVPFLPDPVLEKSDPDLRDLKIPDPDPT